MDPEEQALLDAAEAAKAADDTKGDDDKPDPPAKSKKDDATKGDTTVNDPEKKRLSDEAAKHRIAARDAEKKAAELQKKLDDREKADLEAKGELAKVLEIERKERQAEKDKHERWQMTSAVKAELEKAGFIDLDFHTAVDRGELKLDDDGNVVGLKAQIDALKTAKPHMFKEPGTAAGDKPASGTRSLGATAASPNAGAKGTPVNLMKLSKGDYMAAEEKMMEELERTAG